MFLIVPGLYFDFLLNYVYTFFSTIALYICTKTVILNCYVPLKVTIKFASLWKKKTQ